jgi:uncharacterized protein with FMN-binding domain
MAVPVEINSDRNLMRKQVDSRFRAGAGREAIRILYELKDRGEGAAKRFADYYIAEGLIWAKEIPFAMLEYEQRLSESVALLHYAKCYLYYDQFTEAMSCCQRALELKEDSDTPTGMVAALGLWAMAEVHREKGDFNEAAGTYRRALEAFEAESQAEGFPEHYRKNHEKNMDRIRGMLALCGNPPDVSSVGSGVYRARSQGYVGPVEVKVSIRDGRIEKVTISDQSESLLLDTIEAIPHQIVSSQSISVDSVTGATYTSNAIMGAVYRALEKGLEKGT